MKKIIITILAVVVLSSVSNEISAQTSKFGYLNSTELLLLLPEVKTADQSIEVYQNQLIEKGKSMASTLEANYQKYVKDAQSGVLTGLQMQQRESELQKEQQAIQLYENEIVALLGQKRQELYQPILDNVNKIVQQIGKEDGYTMIFDTSSGALIHVPQGENIIDKVKSKLGI